MTAPINSNFSFKSVKGPKPKDDIEEVDVQEQGKETKELHKPTLDELKELFSIWTNNKIYGSLSMQKAGMEKRTEALEQYIKENNLEIGVKNLESYFAHITGNNFGVSNLEEKELEELLNTFIENDYNPNYNTDLIQVVNDPEALNSILSWYEEQTGKGKTKPTTGNMKELFSIWTDSKIVGTIGMQQAGREKRTEALEQYIKENNLDIDVHNLEQYFAYITGNSFGVSELGEEELIQLLNNYIEKGYNPMDDVIRKLISLMGTTPLNFDFSQEPSGNFDTNF